MPTRSDRRGLLRRAQISRGVLPYALANYTVAELPAAAEWIGAHVYVSDEISGGVEAFSDGINWRRVTDRTIVSAAAPCALYGLGAAIATLEAVVGPYLRSNGVAVGTMRGASFAGGGLSSAGATVGTLQTPPKAPTDLSAAGAATGTLVGAAA